jgi:fibronectin type 3 domain-containing protein
VIAVLIGPNAVAVKWTGAARAEYYRVWKKVVGVDEEFIALNSPHDLDYTIEGLPANATVQIVVTAVNNGGESAKSEVVTVTTA